MKLSEDLPEAQLEDWFASLRIITPRNPISIQRGRQDFLAQASTLISQTQIPRRTGWIYKIIDQLKSKEYSPMFAMFASLFLVVALLFGGGGAAALAAQSSLPDQAFYQLKTLAEDLVLGSSFSTTQRLQLELDFADRRVSEVIRLREMGLQVPPSTCLRLENHIDQALRVAANSENGEMVRILNQIRERLQLLINTLPAHDPEMLRIREMIHLRIDWTEFGLQEPNDFRLQAQQRTRFNQEVQSQEPGAPMPNISPGTGTEAISPASQGEASQYNDCQVSPCGPVPELRYGQDPKSGENQSHDPYRNNRTDSGRDLPGPSLPAENSNPGISPDLQQGSGNNTEISNSNQDAAQENGSPQGNGGRH